MSKTGPCYSQLSSKLIRILVSRFLVMMKSYIQILLPWITELTQHIIENKSILPYSTV